MNWLFGTFFVCLAVSAGSMVIMQIRTKRKSEKAFAIEKTKAKDDKKSEKADAEKRNSFQDVAGLCEVKKDMATLVDFLRNGEKYIDAGAEIPKGAILYGPPGTGKTLLARAIAGEAEVPFYNTSGSEFAEKYVGIGAKRIRELFDKAEKNAPCIVFIDEIDAVGGNRDGAMDNTEDLKTLEELLNRMDGFKSSSGVLVIGATNRLNALDPALVRPGRFDKKFCVPLPETVEERMEIISLYAKNKRFMDDVNLEQLAKETIGCSPAEIKSILNDAAIMMVQENKAAIDKAILDKVFTNRMMQGHLKENRKLRDKDEQELIAWHEAGHAVMGKVFDMEVTKVTIVGATSGAGGVTFTIPSKLGLLSVEDIEHKIMQLYAGRAAEYILYANNGKKVTTGASSDIDEATKLIYRMVTEFGMSEEYGMLNLTRIQVKSSDILLQMKRIADELEEKTISILKEHEEQLRATAHLLMEKETIYAEDLEKIMLSTVPAEML